jgi:hypothetical protein
MILKGRVRPMVITATAAVAVGACCMLTTTPTTVTAEGWTVVCTATAAETCSAVASLALNNMARSRPSVPTGVIRVVARGACAPVPDWADGTKCFDAHVPVAPTKEVCLVVAPRPTLGGYGQVGGDEVSGQALPPDHVPALACLTLRTLADAD